MKKLVLKYWQDPVWSKIISVVILSLGAIIYNYIASLINQTGFLFQLKEFLSIKIDLWIIIFSFLVMCIVYYLILKIRPQKELSFRYDAETLDIDRNLFDKIRNEYIDKNALQSLAYNSFSSRPFGCKELEFMEKIIHDSIDPNFEFINPNLEKLKLEFVISTENLKDYVDKNTFSTNAPPSSDDIWLRVPREWNVDKVWKVQGKIKELENIAYHNWKEFIRQGRIILKI